MSSMLKRLAYIVLLLIFAVSLSSAKTSAAHGPLAVVGNTMRYVLATDTTRKPKADDDTKKIKEISRAKRQVKPEKISADDKGDEIKNKQKPKRERRPEGLDRPPEIPRRNSN